jgi:chloramphenicol 3-O-phosphotransferase
VRNGSLQLELGSDGRRVLSAFHRSVAAVVNSGVNVVCEAIVYDEADWDDWSDALQRISCGWVRLSASLAALDQREQERAGAAQGLGRGMAARRAVGRYDVEADASIETTAAIVIRTLRTRRA